MDKLVSAVIPTYRRHSDIVIDAINSIKGQTYKNIEIIIVDDNGNDNKEYSEELYLALRNIDGVRYYRQEKNLGACFARNTGIELSNGDYIAFLDDDDCWKKDKIERQLPLFNNPDVGLAYCGTELIYPNGNRK